MKVSLAPPKARLHTEPSWDILQPPCLLLGSWTQPAGQRQSRVGSWTGEATGPEGNWIIRL